jgi:hypothetical protein
MKATLEFNLPEEEQEHRCALAGHDALMLIDELETEIANRIDEGNGCAETLDKIWGYIIAQKDIRRLPDLL